MVLLPGTGVQYKTRTNYFHLLVLYYSTRYVIALMVLAQKRLHVQRVLMDENIFIFHQDSWANCSGEKIAHVSKPSLHGGAPEKACISAVRIG
jgi:hypothetical protein